MKAISPSKAAAGDGVPAKPVPARQILWLAPGFCLWFSALVFVYVRKFGTEELL